MKRWEWKLPSYLEAVKVGVESAFALDAGAEPQCQLFIDMVVDVHQAGDLQGQPVYP